MSNVKSKEKDKRDGNTFSPFKKVYATVSATEFSNFAKRLKAEGVVTEDGRPDFGKALSTLVTLYGNGVVLSFPQKTQSKAHTGADYLNNKS